LWFEKIYNYLHLNCPWYFLSGFSITLFCFF
jgi:hypothetical protein